MSRLSRERVLIALAPDALAYARASRAPRPAVVRHQTVACDPAAGQEPWQGAVAALAPLAESLKNERVDATVVLSNHFVRYALVTRDPGLETGDEELAFARFCFARIHGERSKAWQVRLDRGGTGAACVASAVDDGLLRALRECFKPAMRARLVSVQPYLMAAFNRWGRQLPAASALLLLVEQGRACLARMEGGRWSAVHSARGNFDGAPAWAGFLERERHREAGGAAATEVLVHAPLQAAQSLEYGNWRFKPVLEPQLKGIAARPDPFLSLALCAL